MDLAQLGWSAEREEAFGPLRAQGLIPGRVAIEDKRRYRVLSPTGELTATVAGSLLHKSHSSADLPKVGDWLALQPLESEAKGVIRQVLPRRTYLTRKAAGREVESQVLAANLDYAFIVQALDQTYNRRRLERYLVMVREGGAQPVVVLNKADLCADLEPLVTAARQVAGAAPTFVVSALAGTGLEQLAPYLRPGETVVFLGPSGVGKSSLINRLYGQPIQATLAVRATDAKGRHATTWRELIRLPGGALVIDTPGLREFHLWLADEGVQEAFPEVAELAANCRFRDCAHTGEQGCAVRQAVAAGQLDPARYASYLKLRAEQQSVAQAKRKLVFLRARRRRAGENRRLAASAPPWEEESEGD